MPTWSRQSAVVRTVQGWSGTVTEVTPNVQWRYQIDETSSAVSEDGVRRYRWTLQIQRSTGWQTIASGESAPDAVAAQNADVVRQCRENMSSYFGQTLTMTPA